MGIGLKVLALLAVGTLAANAQERPKRNWNISVAFLVGAQAMDAVSSRGLVELNPVLGRGQFGTRQVAVKSGIASAMILTELLFVRRHPETRRSWTWVNYGTGIALSSFAVSNWSQSR